MSELYHIAGDPDGLVNRINAPASRARTADTHAVLNRRLIAPGAGPGEMPLDEGIGPQLPPPSIRS